MSGAVEGARKGGTKLQSVHAQRGRFDREKKTTVRMGGGSKAEKGRKRMG